MTSSAIQTPKMKLETFEQAGNEIATLRHLTAGNEAEVRRAHTEIAMLKLANAQAEKPAEQKPVDLSGIIARLTALEARPAGDDATSLVRAIADELGTLQSRLLADAKRLSDLEQTVGKIGAQFISLASKAA